MALSENVKLFLKLEASETANTLGGLKERAELLTQALESTKIGTEEYKNLNQQLINTSKQVKNLELGFEALDAEQVAAEVGSVAGAVGDIGAGLVLLSGGNEELEEMVGRIEGALGATMALKGGIEGLQSARKLWNDAMARGNKLTQIAIALQETLNKASKANIFLAFAAAVTAVALAIWKWGKNATATEIAQEKLNEAQLAGAKAAGEEEAKVKVLAATLMDATASTDARKDALDRLNEVIPDTIGYITEETIATGEAIEVIEEYIRLVKQRAELTALENMLAEQIGERVRLQVALQQEGNDASGMAIDMTKNAIEESKVLENQLLQQINALQKNISATEDSGDTQAKTNSVTKDGIREMRSRTSSLKEDTEATEKNTEAKDLNAEAERRLADEKAAAIEEITKAESDFQESQLDKQSQEINAVQDKYFRLIELAEQFGQDTKTLEEARATEIAEIEDTFRQEKLEKEREFYAAILEEEIKLAEEKEKKQEEANEVLKNGAQDLLNATEALANFQSKKDLQRAKEKVKRGEALTKAEIKRLERQDKINKAFALAQIAADTARGISAAIAAGAGLPFPANLGAIASGVAAVISGATQAAQVLGESPDIPQVDTPSADLDSVSDDLSEDTPQNDFSFGSTLLNQPNKVYVVESDITATQNKVSVIESQATFG